MPVRRNNLACGRIRLGHLGIPYLVTLMLQSVLRHRTLLTFLLCCTAITAVSVHDAVLVVLHEEVISELSRTRWAAG